MYMAAMVKFMLATDFEGGALRRARIKPQNIFWFTAATVSHHNTISSVERSGEKNAVIASTNSGSSSSASFASRRRPIVDAGDW